MRTLLASAGTLGFFLSLSGCSLGDLGPTESFREDFHYNFPVGQSVRIEAESFNGGIGIEGWDSPSVEIAGVKYGSTEAARDAVKVDVHHTADSVEILVSKPSDFSGNMGAKFTLRVPRSAFVARAASSNGAIQIQDVARAESLRTSNGPIKVAGVQGDLEAETSNGPIHVDDFAGGLKARTSNGGIVVRFSASPSKPIRLITSNGPVELSLDKAPLADIRAVTQNSPITLHLPADTAAKITADTSNSPVSCDFSLTGENEKGHLSGTIGSGGPLIDLSTSNGPIRVQKGM